MSGTEVKHLFLLFAVTLGMKDCTFWQTLNDCTSFTTCFWDSQRGSCENVDDWSKESNGPSTCGDQREMFSCYARITCFWRAQVGSCEDVLNWDLKVGPTPDPMSRPCDFWDSSQDCWAIEKCFFDRRENFCKTIHGGVPSNVGPAPPKNQINQNSAPLPALPGAYMGPDFEGGPQTYGGPPAQARPQRYPIPPAQGIFPHGMQPNGYPGGPQENPHMLPPGALNHGDNGIPPVLTTSYPSMQPTAFWEPMNLCESLRDRNSCAYGDGCIWDVQDHRCLQLLDGYCGALHSEGMCLRSEECSWNSALKECYSLCRSQKEIQCAYSEECFWNKSECLANNVRCDQLMSPSQCMHNEFCYWNEGLSTCRSFFTSCKEIDMSEHCGMNDKCLWSDEKQECGSLVDNKNTSPPMINCEDIADVEVCNTSSSTEHNMPCEWDMPQDKCVEYAFDCEDFETAVTCNGASFRGIECYWKGECDNRRLILTAPFQSNIKNEPATTFTPLMQTAVFLLCSFVGLFCVLSLLRCFKRSYSSPELSEPIHGENRPLTPKGSSISVQDFRGSPTYIEP